MTLFQTKIQTDTGGGGRRRVTACCTIRPASLQNVEPGSVLYAPRTTICSHMLIAYFIFIIVSWPKEYLNGFGCLRSYKTFKVCSFTATRYINHVSLAIGR